MKYHQGDIVWVQFIPNQINSVVKIRPAVIVSGKTANSLDSDYVIIPITTRLRGDAFAIQLEDKMVDRPLPKTSEMRCNKLATVEERLIQRKLTILKPEFLSKVLGTVRQVFE